MVIFHPLEMAASSQSMLKTAFPLYAINSIGDQYVMISGGGGAAKTGVLNTIVRKNIQI